MRCTEPVNMVQKTGCVACARRMPVNSSKQVWHRPNTRIPACEGMPQMLHHLVVTVFNNDDRIHIVYPVSWTHFQVRTTNHFVVFNCAVAFFGLLTIGIACLASKFTTQLVQASTTIWGVIDGPVAGMFIMGFFMPFSNSAVRVYTFKK